MNDDNDDDADVEVSSSSNDSLLKDDQEAVTQKKITEVIFEKFRQFEHCHAFKHLAFVSTKRGLFIYIPFISLEFEESCKSFFKTIFSKIDFLKEKQPGSLERHTTSCSKTRKSPERKFFKELQSLINNDKTSSSYYWLIIQFNFHSIGDCLRTNNFPLSEEDSTKICEFFLQKYLYHLQNKITYSFTMKCNLYDHFKTMAIRKRRLEIPSLITHNRNIINASLVDD